MSTFWKWLRLQHPNGCRSTNVENQNWYIYWKWNIQKTGYQPAGAVNTSTTYLHEAGKTNITKGIYGLIGLKTSPVNATLVCEHTTIEFTSLPWVSTDVVYSITNLIPTLNITPSSTMCDLLQPGSTMVYYQLTGHRDIQPNPGPPRRRSKVSSSEWPPILASDLPAGLKVTQWNLKSMAPREGKVKLDQLKTILHDPIKDTHILGITETCFVMNLVMLLFLSKDMCMKEGIGKTENYHSIRMGGGGLWFIYPLVSHIPAEETWEYKIWNLFGLNVLPNTTHHT